MQLLSVKTTLYWTEKKLDKVANLTGLYELVSRRGRCFIRNDIFFLRPRRGSFSPNKRIQRRCTVTGFIGRRRNGVLILFTPRLRDSLSPVAQNFYAWRTPLPVMTAIFNHKTQDGLILTTVKKFFFLFLQKKNEKNGMGEML